MPPPPPFQIRDTPLPEDTPFILSALDSALPHLASTGSAAQWGTVPRSTQPVYITRMSSAIDAALSGTNPTEAVFIAELRVTPDLDTSAGEVRVDEQGQRVLKIGAAAVTANFPGYVLEQPGLEGLVREAVARGDSVYLSVMVSDFRVGDLRKGAGAVLLQRVKQYARDIGKAAIYLDCWAGNEGGLVRYYEKQGFVAVEDFWAKKEDGTVWHGKLMRMDVERGADPDPEDPRIEWVDCRVSSGMKT